MVKQTISFIIPIFNALNLLESNFYLLMEYLSKIRIESFEIILINDGSNDESALFLDGISHPNVIVVHHPVNKGLGGVLTHGIALAQMEQILYLDIDFSYGLDNIEKLIAESTRYDCVVCSKYLNKNDQIPRNRYLYRNTYTLLLRIFVKLPVLDIGSGAVIFKTAILKNINLVSRGFTIHLEIFLTLQAQGKSIKEIPIVYTHQPGTFSLRKHLFQTFWETTKLLFFLPKHQPSNE